MDRRRFLQSGGLAGLLATLGAPARAATPRLGPLRPDPDGLIELPAGFRYVVIDRAGDPTDDGWRVPGDPDGMACFAGPSGDYALLRNHELTPRQVHLAGWPADQPPPEAFAPGALGAVSRAVVTAGDLRRTRCNLVIAGTVNNCSGGATPWGWVSCEESDADGHGWAFLCPADAARLRPARPLRSWGRFRREAVALDLRSGIVYQTEDHPQGALYRHVPDDPADPFSGRLEALVVVGCPNLDTSAALSGGDVVAVAWAPIPDPTAVATRCREQAAAGGAATFRRGEGIGARGDAIWFTATGAGAANAGHIYCLRPGEGTLELAVEITDRGRLSQPDNLTFTPWGDLLVAEDNYHFTGGATHNHLRGVTSAGGVYDLARSVGSGGEFAGPCFSPDGAVLFVNLQKDQLTVGITGPFPGVSPLRP